jgi:hypothetical protein
MKRWAKFNQREELEKARARIYAPARKTSMAKVITQGVVSFLFIYALLVVWLIAGQAYAS